MPSLYKGVCYPTLLEANSALYADLTSSIPPSNTYNHISTVSFNGVEFVLNLKQIRINNGNINSNVNTSLPILSLPDCINPNDPLSSFQDGHLLGWGVATVMIIAYAIRSIYRRG
jgi:hypothetical protein